MCEGHHDVHSKEFGPVTTRTESASSISRLSLWAIIPSFPERPPVLVLAGGLTTTCECPRVPFPLAPHEVYDGNSKSNSKNCFLAARSSATIAVDHR